MQRIILFLLVLILGCSNHLELSIAGNLSDRLTDYPRWMTKPVVSFASGDLVYRKFGLKPRPFRTALSYNGKSDNQAKN